MKLYKNYLHIYYRDYYKILWIEMLKAIKKSILKTYEKTFKLRENTTCNEKIYQNHSIKQCMQ